MRGQESVRHTVPGAQKGRQVSKDSRPVVARNVRVVPQSKEQQRVRVERLAVEARGRARRAGQ